jgi:hypothetical protein
MQHLNMLHVIKCFSETICCFIIIIGGMSWQCEYKNKCDFVFLNNYGRKSTIQKGDLTWHINRYPAEHLINVTVRVSNWQKRDVNVFEYSTINQAFQVSENKSILALSGNKLVADVKVSWKNNKYCKK